jgi:hypothetical protein
VEGAEVVAQVQQACGTVSGEHAEPPGIPADRLLQRSGAALGGGHPQHVGGRRKASGEDGLFNIEAGVHKGLLAAG